MHSFSLLALAVRSRFYLLRFQGWSYIFSKLAVGFVAAKQIVITVGYNTTNDATKVFQPASVIAQTGDIVYFNCEW